MNLRQVKEREAEGGKRRERKLRGGKSEGKVRELFQIVAIQPLLTLMQAEYDEST